MINLDDYCIFSKHESSLSDTSKDTCNNKRMTSSNIRVINFDKVMQEYTSSLSISDLASNDALFCDDDCLVFVEFKNGCIKRNNERNIRKKVYDSVLVFTDITSMHLSEMRTCMKYILVYNIDHNPDEDNEQDSSSRIQNSPEYDVIANDFGKLAQNEIVKFDLEMFCNYCFKEVHTYTQKEFEQYLKEHCHSCPTIS